MAEEDMEYESDPEEARLSLKMRRRVASDDEEEGEERGVRADEPPRRIDESDSESEGAPADYEEDELEGGEEGYGSIEEYLEEEGEEAEYDGGIGGNRGDDSAMVAVERAEGGEEEDVKDVCGKLLKEKKRVSDDGSLTEEEEEEDGDDDENRIFADGQLEENRKEIEPFIVPTAGVFYMHDDRFRDNPVSRNRRTHGRRKLWECKDDKKWAHDMFEELTMQERCPEEHRSCSRGRYRGRDRTRGAAHGYTQQSRPREYTSSKHNINSVKGRGPQWYHPSLQSESSFTQNKQYGKSVEKHPGSAGRRKQLVSNAESDAVLPRKQVTSSLNVASPPFYPTGSSTKDGTVTHKRDVLSGPQNRNGPQSVMDTSSNIPQPTGTAQEINTTTSIGLHKLFIGDSPSAMSGKPSNSVLPSLSVSSSVGPSQTQFRSQGSGLNSFAQMVYQTTVSSSQSNIVNSPSQLQSILRNSGQIHAQSSGQASLHQFAQHVPSGSQAYSPPKSSGVVTAIKSEEIESMPVTTDMKTASNDKGKGDVQGSGKGPFIYSGSQVMGASTGHGDQNFPAFLPVMKFGAQHPGGRVGVPAVGMAIPGYVGQPQLGLGSSEMTWLPVLAGAAGALGATFCPSYITVDGSYSTHSGLGPSTTATSSKENNTTKVGIYWKPDQKPNASENVGQRQRNPRRYTEMKFDQ